MRKKNYLKNTEEIAVLMSIYEKTRINELIKALNSIENQEKVFCASRFFRGKEYTHGLVYLTKNPLYQNHVYCFDLKFDPEMVFGLDRG